jgi:hypothetical protein
MLREIAERRQVDVTRDAIAILADERETSRLQHAAMTGITLIALRKAWRKLFVLMALSRRVGEFAHAFELGMLFDHYCQNHHVGAALDAEAAQLLRKAIDEVGPTARRQLILAAARQALGGSAPEVALATVGDGEAETLLAKTRRVITGGLGEGHGGYRGALTAAFDARWRTR